ncbi:hypothetical protein J2T56_002131 [Natronobacillus azotifigens]|uniref:Uncharacterized protein n=1 Tax=Natronobacillus azotifigens TaxID=472978 RepID=A0A9J6REY3_9BACI|nr:hypothetical protein [Natronobacillus azotifigens]MCZ0703899.1 hypothetical protein [Natronobacillus azotifigens]
MSKLVKNIDIIEDHLSKNDRYFRYPEQKLESLFTDVEQQLDLLDKALEDW